MRSAPPRPRGWSLVAARAGIVVGSIVVALLLAEAVARLVGLRPEYGQVISSHGIATRVVDGVPLWNDRFPRADAGDVRRAAADDTAFTVLGLGDSIMYGVRVEKDQTYLEQARGILARASPRRVEVLNLAVPGYNTRQEDAVYKEIAGQLSPDLVIVHYWDNDVHQYRAIGGHVVDFGDVSADGRFVVRALPLPPRLSDFLLVHSRLYDLLTHFAVSRQSATRTNEAMAAARTTEWAAAVATPLAAIDERVKRAGGRLLVLASPVFTGPAPRPSEDLPRLRALAAGRGFEVIDLSAWLEGLDPAQVALEDRCHFSVEGHRVIGERLAEYLVHHDLAVQ